VWVLATLPDHVEVGGDDVRPYVLLMNSHDCSTAVVAATTPIRVVCQNTLNWSLANARQKFSIRHTEAVTQRVHEARAASASLALSTMDPRRPARCSSSQPRERVWPGGRQTPAGACRNRPRDATRLSLLWIVKEPARVVASFQGAFAMATRTDNEIRELSPEQWDQRVDEQARKRLGMSGEEFERRLNAGEIDIDDSPDVTRVAMMLPLHATHK